MNAAAQKHCAAASVMIQEKSYTFMKKLLLATVIAAFTSCATAQGEGDIILLSPNKERGTVLMQALADRQSHRECADKELSTADLSDLLWAANGINRPEKGMRTAPSALNRQDIDIYVVTGKGTYKYLPDENRLMMLEKGDHRNAVASGQDFVKQFPVSLVLVSDLSKFGDKNNDRTLMMAAIDAGHVSQNICLFCSGTGLVTVPRATMDNNALKRILHLGDTQIPLLNNPVGYKRGE